MKLSAIILLPIFVLSGCTTNYTSSDSQTTNQNKQYGFGDSVKVGNVVFQINNATNTNKIGTEYVGAETEYNFVILNLTVKNIGKKEISLLSDMMTLHNGDKTYETHSSGIYLENGFYVIETIGADISKTINVVYETPIEYTPDFYLVVKESSYSYTSDKIYLKWKEKLCRKKFVIGENH